jgi:hypothetical protein
VTETIQTVTTPEPTCPTRGANAKSHAKQP